MLLCIVWQGIDWLREKKFAKGIGCHCRRFVLAVCGGSISAALPRGTGDAHCFNGRGLCHHQPAAHVDNHHGRRLELFAGRCAAVCPAGASPRTADGMGTCSFSYVILCRPLGWLCRQADFVWTQMFTDYYEWFGVAAVLLMLLYNGQRGSGHKQLFYWFYPAHVYLLYGASCLAL